MSRRIRWNQVHIHGEIYLFVLPTCILIALFQYYPAASGIFHSFFRWNGADISEWVGFNNYIDLVQSRAFWISFQVAFVLGIWNVIKMVPALIVAVCIHRCRSPRMQFLYRILFVIPMVMPGLIVILIWRTFFFEATAGYLNQFLVATGIYPWLCRADAFFGWGGIFTPDQLPAWLGDPRLILVACIVWGFPWVGSFAVLTHLAKLQNIPKELYEASELDGVNWWNKFTRIELPLIMGSIYLILVFVVIDTVKDAGLILALAGMEGGPGGVVTVPALFMLRKAFLDQEMGYACAVGVVLTIVVMALQKLSSIVLNWSEMSRRGKRLTEVFLVSVGVACVVFGFLPLVAFLGLLIWTVRKFQNRRRRPVEPVAGLVAEEPVEHVERPSFAERIPAPLLRFGRHAFIIAVLLFAMLPLYLMLIVSFKTNQQYYEAPARITQPLHPENWVTAWELVGPAVANSVVISTWTTVLTVVFALAAAYFFARYRMPLSGFLWNAMLVLMMMPTIANLVPLFRLLIDLNLVNTLTALILVGASAGQVFCIFVLRNFVEDIPRDLFEAAEIDGANHLQQLWLIVTPVSGPILGTVGIMQFLHAWNDFILPLIIMRDEARLPVMVQLLRLAGEYFKLWGPLMAGYAIASIPIIVLFILCMKLFVRGMTDGAVKG